MSQGNFRTISKDMVGQPHFKGFGNCIPVSSFMGQILPQDVGKRVYKRGEVLQVENQEQFTKRLEQEGVSND